MCITNINIHVHSNKHKQTPEIDLGFLQWLWNIGRSINTQGCSIAPHSGRSIQAA